MEIKTASLVNINDFTTEFSTLREEERDKIKEKICYVLSDTLSKIFSSEEELYKLPEK
ncbi:MAG: hypothetical protein IJ666_05395 [Ruminococcus sp.]|nr:hypothetical protein [Ruminococcus sp.]